MTTSFNCYPRAFAGRSTTNATADSLRCGECFSCISMSLASGERRKSEMVFALSSDHTAMNKLLVLIASVHKYYPSTKILLYDNEIGSDLLQKRLISVRNVIVIPAEVATQHPSDEADKFQWNACFLWDALTRYRTVLWLNDDLEFLSRNLDEILNKTTSPITAIGREYTTDIRKHGFVPYFPGTVTPRNYTMLLLRTGAGKTFQCFYWNIVLVLSIRLTKIKPAYPYVFSGNDNQLLFQMLVLQGAILTMCVTGICGVSLLEAYHSDAQTARRRGMLNVRFRPVMHLRGTDDWRKQVGMETLHNQMMDENGIVFDLRPPTNDKVSSIFSAPTNTHG
ncbi:unnamed protein product [Haemonchus placei]|uniref:Glyco_transf_64 domain-containing protein n=1 Tax=Haemonchus placei TaxID=6290 RepID=A0A158QM42_HAEPC|nr:unnamed protein product [Haemonchus placei]